MDFRPHELLCDAGLTFFVNLLASEISFVGLDKTPNKNSDDDGTVVALHKAANSLCRSFFIDWCLVLFISCRQFIAKAMPSVRVVKSSLLSDWVCFRTISVACHK